MKSQTLNRPPVSGEVSGCKVILRSNGVGNVRNSSVCVQVALGALMIKSAHMLESSRSCNLEGERTYHRHRSQNSMSILG